MSPQIKPVARKMSPIEAWAREFLRPEDDLPVHRWAAKHFVMDASGPKGLDFYDPTYAPWMNEILDSSAEPHVRRITTMCSAQGGKTAGAIISLGRSIAEDPGPVLWLSSKELGLKQDVKSRIKPSFERTGVIARQMSQARGDKNVMELYLRNGTLIKFGSGQSDSDLTGKPIRNLYCDEVRDWPPGNLGMALKRLQKWKGLSKAHIFSTPRAEHDDIHLSFLAGDQRHWYVKCPCCGEEQTLVWSGENGEGQYYGMMWDKNETTFNATEQEFENQWNWDELRKTVRYVCKHCYGTMFVDDPASQAAVTLNGRWIPHRPQIKDHRSYTWNTLIDPYGESPSVLVKEYLLGKYMEQEGVLQHLYDFWNQRMAVPVGNMTERAKLENIENYDPNEPLGEGEILIMTVDVQVLGKFYALIWKWLPGGRAKFVACKCCQGWDEVRVFQLDHQVRSQCVFVDCGHWPSEVFAACIKYQEVKEVKTPRGVVKKIVQWRAIKGDGTRDHYTWMVDNGKGHLVKVNKPVSRSEKADPAMGKRGQGRSGYAEMFYFASNEIMNILQQMVLKKTFVVPPGADPEFHKQMNAERRVKKGLKWVWEKISGRENHYGDCAKMQVAAAIRGNLLKWRDAKVEEPADVEKQTSNN